jgi:hypothetical protein
VTPEEKIETAKFLLVAQIRDACRYDNVLLLLILIVEIVGTIHHWRS